MVDNFDLLREHLTFEDKHDVYIIHIISRPKDNKASTETTKMIKTFYVNSLEYFDSKKLYMKELCAVNNARAYLLPQPRDNGKCLIELTTTILEHIQRGDTTVKPEALVRKAYSGFHQSRKKQWIIDIDDDNMHGWTMDNIVKVVKDGLDSAGRPGQFYLVPTKHGSHIVTSPFDLQTAHKICPMMFEGQSKDGVGWLHKDGATLLYCE